MHFCHKVSKTIFEHVKYEIFESHSSNHFLELYLVGFASFHFLMMFQEKIPFPKKHHFGIFHRPLFEFSKHFHFSWNGLLLY